MQKNIPKLRFPEFNDEWEEKRLGDIGVFYKGRGISKQDIVEGGSNKCVRYGELYTRYFETIDDIYSSTNQPVEKSFLSKKYDVLIPSSGETPIDIATVTTILSSNVLLGGDLNVIRPNTDNNGVFFAYYLRSFKKINIAKISQGHSVVHLYNSHLKSLKISTPELKEQNKISDFLISIDGWINNLKSQKENLEKYKKGLMQKIFSQEIRFKDENGKDFPKWEEKKLSELVESYNGLTNKTAIDFGTGRPFVTYKQIFDSNEINILKFAMVNVNDQENQNKVKYGDILFTTSSETPHEVAFSSVLLSKTASPYLNSFSFGVRPKSFDSLYPNYSKYFFRSPIFRRQIIRLAQGSTRYNISKVEFLKIKIDLPIIGEQIKIANFLTSVDKVIESKQQQIVLAENWKKGLMQRMFM